MGEKGRILIADSDEMSLQTMAELLRRADYECAGALDTAASRALFHSADYDLLIADLALPGNQDLALIRDLPRTAIGLTAIVVAEQPSLESAIVSLKLPVVAYLTKPVDAAELLVEVRHAVEFRRTYQAVSNTRHRLQDRQQDLERIEQLMHRLRGDASAVALDAFCTLTFHNLADCLADLQHVMDAFARHREERKACHLFDCSRLTALTSAVGETVEVLEKTKSAFKSKELGGLRRKLEGLVKTGAVR